MRYNIALLSKKVTDYVTFALRFKYEQGLIVSF